MSSVNWEYSQFRKRNLGTEKLSNKSFINGKASSVGPAFLGDAKYVAV